MLPDQGGILWSQSLAIFKDSQKQELALEFVKYIMSPEGQARLATSSCFWGMPANRKAGDVLKDRLEHATVIIVSHQARTLEKFARSAAVLRHGQIHMFDTLEEAKQLYDYEAQS